MSSLAPFTDAVSLLQAANIVPAANIRLPNTPFDQPTDAIWMSIDAYSDQLDIQDLGANHWAERGQIMVYLYAPAQTGTETIRQLAKTVCNTFRGLPPRNPYYHAASIGAGGLSDAGNNFILPISIAFVFED